MIMKATPRVWVTANRSANRSWQQRAFQSQYKGNATYGCAKYDQEVPVAKHDKAPFTVLLSLGKRFLSPDNGNIEFNCNSDGEIRPLYASSALLSDVSDYYKISIPVFSQS
jgi:hypothetical protein